MRTVCRAGKTREEAGRRCSRRRRGVEERAGDTGCVRPSTRSRNEEIDGLSQRPVRSANTTAPSTLLYRQVVVTSLRCALMTSQIRSADEPMTNFYKSVSPFLLFFPGLTRRQMRLLQTRLARLSDARRGRSPVSVHHRLQHLYDYTTSTRPALSLSLSILVSRSFDAGRQVDSVVQLSSATNALYERSAFVNSKDRAIAQDHPVAGRKVRATTGEEKSTHR